MPPVAAELAIGDALQPDRFLPAHDLGDDRISGGTQRGGVDLAMLEGPTRVVMGFPLPNRRAELGQAWLEHQHLANPGARPDLSLDAIATALGVPVLARHTALGDATTVALCWLALQARTG